MLALTLHQLGRDREAEMRRAEAVDGYRALGAVALEARFAEQW